jgi:hypothetical protein
MKRYHSEIKELQRKETFDKNFKELSNFLKEFNHFPEKSDNPKLYAWMASLMTEHKRNRLDQKYVEQLNSIGFIWSRREFNWFNKAEEVKKMLLEDKIIPSYDKDTTLYHWLNSNLELFHRNRLSEDKKLVINEINELLKDIQNSIVEEPIVKISARELKWTQKLKDLVLFRNENPKSWPQIEATDEAEKKLGIWCQDLRRRFRKKLLEEHWISKLEEIEFNFEGKFDNWKDRFEELNNFLQINHEAPDTKNELYTWARLQFNRFFELPEEKQELLQSINFLNYFEEKSWDKRYSDLKEFVMFYKKIPTKKSNQELYNWLSVQRAKHKKGELSDNETSLLLKLGVDLSPTETREDVWNFKYDALIKFREKNPDRWPSFFSEGIEKKIYEWCQAQRQVNAKTAQRRRELSQDRIKKLNKIGFHWSLDELIDKNWEDTFKKLENFIAENNSTIIPATIDGKYNSLYTWIRNQKIAIQKGKLSTDKVERLMTLGVIARTARV